MLQSSVLRMSIKRFIRTPIPRNISFGYPISSSTPRTLSTTWNHHSFPIMNAQSHRCFATYGGKNEEDEYDNERHMEEEEYKETKRAEKELRNELSNRLKSLRGSDRKRIPEIMKELHPLLKKPMHWMPVLGAYDKVGDLKGGYELLEKMRSRNCKPDTHIYSKLITSCV